MSVRMGINGLDHNHVFEIVDRLVKAGAEAACHVQDGGFLEAYEGWQTESRPVTFDEMLADDTIQPRRHRGDPQSARRHRARCDRRRQVRRHRQTRSHHHGATRRDP